MRTVHKAENATYEKLADSGFAIKNVLVEGRDHTDADVLRALLNVQKGDPIFAFDPDAAKEMIERLPWVREAHVERRLPDTIFVGLVERKALALWQDKGKIRVIDEAGQTITDKPLPEFKNLVIVVGDDAPRHAPGLISMIALEPVLKERVEAANWIGDRRWDLTLKSGAVVKLPEKDVALAFRRLVKAQKEDGLLDKRVDSIDVREAGRLIIRTKPGAVQDYKAEHERRARDKGDAI